MDQKSRDPRGSREKKKKKLTQKIKQHISSSLRGHLHFPHERGRFPELETTTLSNAY